MKKISVALLTALFSATIIHSSWAIGDVNVGGEGIKEISLPGMGIPQDQSLAPRALPSALNNEEGLGINMGDETEGLPTVQQVAGVNIEPIASAPQLQAQSNAPTPTGKIKTSATVPTQTAKLLQSSAKQVALIGSKLNGQPPSQDASMESLTASGKPFDGNDAVMATDDYNTDNRQRVMDQTFQSLFGDWKDANHAWTSKEKLAKKMAELIQREIADELIWQDLTGTYYEGHLLAPAVLPLTVAIAHMAQTTPNKKAFLEQVAELERRINAILYSTSNPDKALQGIISAINGNPQSNARPIAEFTQAQSNAQHPIPETSILFTRSSYHDDQQLTDAIRGAVYFGYMTLAGVDYVEIRTPTIDDAARIAQTLSALSQVNAIFVSPATLNVITSHQTQKSLSGDMTIQNAVIRQDPPVDPPVVHNLYPVPDITLTYTLDQPVIIGLGRFETMVNYEASLHNVRVEILSFEHFPGPRYVIKLWGDPTSITMVKQSIDWYLEFFGSSRQA